MALGGAPPDLSGVWWPGWETMLNRYARRSLVPIASPAPFVWADTAPAPRIFEDDPAAIDDLS